jgi:hypothetical protein
MIHQPIETQVIIAATIGGVVILNAAILWFVPRLTRPDLYFAVTVPAGFPDEPDGKLILGRYRRELILVSVSALIVFVGQNITSPYNRVGSSWFRLIKV